MSAACSPATARAGTTRCRRRWSAASVRYQLQANYTWSKSLGYGHYRQVFSQIGGPGATPQDYNNLPDSKSFMHFDIPHVFNILEHLRPAVRQGPEVPERQQPDRQRVWSAAGRSRSAHVYRKGTLIWLTTPGNPLGNGVLFAPVTKANLGPAPDPDRRRPHHARPEQSEHALVQSGAPSPPLRRTRWARRRSTTTTSGSRRSSPRTSRSSSARRCCSNDKNPVVLDLPRRCVQPLQPHQLRRRQRHRRQRQLRPSDRSAESARALITMGLRLEF